MAVLAIGVGFAAYTFGKGQAPQPKIERQRAFVPEFNVVEIPVPERPVPAGTLVRNIPIRMEKFPEHQLPVGAVRDLGLVRDSITLTALPGGLPIVDSNIGASYEATNPVIGKIPPGMRAMTVKVDATAAVEGWARTGSVVDVLLVEKNRTTVVAEKVQVLSTERSTSPVDDQVGSAIPSTVTLLVTQEQCLAINTAVPLGKIAFALRSTHDSDNWRSTQFSADELSTDKKSLNRARVGGVVTFKVGNRSQRYALVDGSWIPTEEVPEGFLHETNSEEGKQ
jgi:Flp pilus assembly protein CpaB